MVDFGEILLARNNHRPIGTMVLYLLQNTSKHQKYNDNALKFSHLVLIRTANFVRAKVYQSVLLLYQWFANNVDFLLIIKSENCCRSQLVRSGLIFYSTPSNIFKIRVLLP